VIDQAVLSAANFIVGLILIRYASDGEYGYYILVFNAIMLLTMLQNSFIGTPYVIKLPELAEAERKQWVGSLLRDQNRWTAYGASLALATTALLWATGLLPANLAWLALAALAAITASLYREFFRNTLLIYQRPKTVLYADMLYVVGIMLGCAIAVQFPIAAIIAILATALSALAGAHVLRRQMRALFDPDAPPGKLAAIAPIGLWAASGAGVYWLFNQGYSFVTAFTLDISAVGALAAARLLMMPANLICSGIQKQLTPLSSQWIHDKGADHTLHRLWLIALILGGGVLLYSALTWLARDWIFLDLMRTDHPQRDAFVILWAAIFFVKALRDPPMLLLVLRQRFRILTFSSSLCAVLSLLLCYFLTLEFGAVGALWGILAGETLSLLAVLVFSWKEARTRPTPA